MFETVALGRHCSNQEYAELTPQLRMQLFTAQRRCMECNIPLLIILEGVDGAGRGSVVNLLSEWMDSKFLRNHEFWMKSDEERARPLDWKFWRCLPAEGKTAVFFGGWYIEPLRRFCCGDIKEHEFTNALHHYRILETELADSGMAIVKIWLHLDKKTHDQRLKKRLNHKDMYHFTPYDKKSSENYIGLIKAASKAITLTDSSSAPWTIVDAEDANYRNLAVVRAIISGVDQAVAAQAAKKERQKAENAAAAQTVVTPLAGAVSTLDTVDLSARADRDLYKKELPELQREVRELSYLAYRKGISSTIIFEGWDAGGKGGTIRRLLSGVDARISQVIPISSPSSEELAHHYLWRFWRHVPRSGFVTVYDRSWYGRVLVERVEKLTPREDLRRAYAEINNFEEQLTAHKNILLKFWLHISQEEQLRRFKERESIEWKNYKITAEDWRNREKWPDYVRAADEMFLRTSTDYAPWHVVAAEDKKLARLNVLRTYAEALRKKLKK